MLHSAKRQIRILLSLLVMLVLVGTLGFMILEQLPLVPACYLTVMTMATVGQNAVRITTDLGQLLAVFLVVMSMGMILSLLYYAGKMILLHRDVRRKQGNIGSMTGIFFSEVGKTFLSMCLAADPQRKLIRQAFDISGQWTESSITDLERFLQDYAFSVDSQKFQFFQCRDLLEQKSDLLIRLLEHPGIAAEDEWSVLFRSCLHLRDTLAARRKSKAFSRAEKEEISGDVQTVYRLLTLQWVAYLVGLLRTQSFLFSLAVHANPFQAK